MWGVTLTHGWHEGREVHQAEAHCCHLELMDHRRQADVEGRQGVVEQRPQAVAHQAGQRLCVQRGTLGGGGWGGGLVMGVLRV